MADFTIKSFDSLPSIQATLTSGVDTVDLTSATSVKFIMKPTAGGTVKVNATAVIVSPATSGVVRYDWTSADTDTPGTYNAEWQVLYPGPKHQTFPTTSYHSITVLADLDGA